MSCCSSKLFTDVGWCLISLAGGGICVERRANLWENFWRGAVGRGGGVQPRNTHETWCAVADDAPHSEVFGGVSLALVPQLQLGVRGNDG